MHAKNITQILVLDRSIIQIDRRLSNSNEEKLMGTASAVEKSHNSGKDPQQWRKITKF